VPYGMSFELMPPAPHDGGMPSSSPHTPDTEAVVVRRASHDDAAALERLASLDSRRRLTGTVILAELDDRILAALSLDDDRVVADPFAPTADLVALLRVRARALVPRGVHGGRRRRATARRRPAVARG
jgi:hypothetical protein